MLDPDQVDLADLAFALDSDVSPGAPAQGNPTTAARATYSGGA